MASVVGNVGSISNLNVRARHFKKGPFFLKKKGAFSKNKKGTSMFIAKSSGGTCPHCLPVPMSMSRGGGVLP